MLSPSTERYDRSTKWLHYQRIESLQEYLLIAQGSPRIDRFIRQEGGDWLYRATIGPESATELRSLGCALTLAQI